MTANKIDYMLIELRDVEKMISDYRNAEMISPEFFTSVEDKIVNFLKVMYTLQAETEKKQKSPRPEEELLAEPKKIEKKNESEFTAILNNIHTSHSLNEVIEKQLLTDIRKGFSLNDKFRFLRELFGGDSEKMDKALDELNYLDSLEASVSYLHTVLSWNIEDPSVAEFIAVLEKRFA